MTSNQIKRDVLKHLRKSKVKFTIDKCTRQISIGGMLLDFPQSGEIIYHYFPSNKASFLSVSLYYVSFPLWLKRIQSFYNIQFSTWREIQAFPLHPTRIVKLPNQTEKPRFDVAKYQSELISISSIS